MAIIKNLFEKQSKIMVSKWVLSGGGKMNPVLPLYTMSWSSFVRVCVCECVCGKGSLLSSRTNFCSSIKQIKL